MNDSRTVLLSLVLGALLSTSLLAQVDSKEWLLKAQFAEYSGDLATAQSCLESAIATDDKESAPFARLRLAAIHRRQGDEASMKEVLEPLMARRDAIGASARRMLQGERPAAMDPSMSPIYRLIGILDKGARENDEEVQTALASLSSLGLMVIPPILERFDTLGVFGRRNTLEFLLEFESSAAVQLLLKGVIEEDRSGEARLCLDWVQSYWHDHDKKIELAACGWNSQDQEARTIAFKILADELHVGDNAELLQRCREYFDKLLVAGIEENGQGPASDLAEVFSHAEILAESPHWERFLEVRVPVSRNAWLIDFWLSRLQSDAEEKFQSVLSKADGGTYYELIMANARLERPLVTGLKAGLGYSDCSNVCLKRCRELSIEISQEDWAAVAAAEFVSPTNKILAFEQLGHVAFEGAIKSALTFARQSDSDKTPESGLRYLVRASPDSVITGLDEVLSYERMKQVLFDYLVEEPSPNKAKITLEILRKGGHYDYRLLTTISVGSGPEQIPALLNLVSVPCLGIDGECLESVASSVIAALRRLMKHEDLPLIMEAQRRFVDSMSERIMMGVASALVQPGDEEMIVRAIMACDQEWTQRQEGQLSSVSATFGDESWRSTTSSAQSRGKVLVHLLLKIGQPAWPVLKSFLVSDAHSFFRRSAAECWKDFDREGQRQVLDCLLESGDYGLMAQVVHSPLTVEDKSLRQKLRKVLPSAPREFYVGKFLENLPAAEKKETCEQLLKSSPLKSSAPEINDMLAIHSFIALGSTRDESLLQTYAEFLDTQLSPYAIEAIGGLYSRKSIPILIKALKHDNKTVQERARKWLEKLETHFSEQKRWQKLLEETQEDAK